MLRFTCTRPHRRGFEEMMEADVLEEVDLSNMILARSRLVASVSTGSRI